MHQDRKIVICIACGRKRYLQVLIPYLLSPQASVVDEVQLWVNTDVQEDLDYLESLERQFPQRLRRIFNPGRITRESYDTTRTNFIFADSVCHFYRRTVDPKTVYVKLDDDICWVHPSFFIRLCDDVVANEDRVFMTMGNVVNVAVTSRIYQEMGVLDHAAGTSTGDPRCPVACIDGHFAAHLHRRFLELHAAGEVERFFFPSYEATGRHRIGASAWTGETFARFGGQVDAADEKDLTQVRARELGMPLRTCGDALVSHFASAHQRAVLEDETDILERYRLIAVKETGFEL